MGPIGVDPATQRYLSPERAEGPVRHGFPGQFLFRFRGIAVYERGPYASAVVSCCYPGVELLARIDATQQRNCRPAAGVDPGNLVQPDGRASGSRRSVAALHGWH